MEWSGERARNVAAVYENDSPTPAHWITPRTHANDFMWSWLEEGTDCGDGETEVEHVKAGDMEKVEERVAKWRESVLASRNGTHASNVNSFT